MTTPEEQAAIDLAERLTTNYECWFFSDCTRAQAVEIVARALLSLNGKLEATRKAIEKAPRKASKRWKGNAAQCLVHCCDVKGIR